MYKVLFIVFINLLFANPTLANEDNSGVHLQLGLNTGLLKTTNNSQRDLHFVAGFNTQFNYVLNHKWSLKLSSYITFVPNQEDTFYGTVGGDEVKGDGQIRSVHFAPNVQYFFDAQPIQGYHLYVSVGANVGINTVKVDDVTVGSIEKTQKLVYETAGGFFSIGIEQRVKSKDDWPIFIELTFLSHIPNRISLVDFSDFSAVDTLESASVSESKIRAKTFLFAIGTTLF